MQKNTGQRTFIIGVGCTAYIKVRCSGRVITIEAPLRVLCEQPRGQRTTEDVRARSADAIFC